ncbi:MAG: hypothetical protein J6D03_00715 [Clostridia bacterium]|nr:hypothetical protein [Clostridia bacterium]
MMKILNYFRIMILWFDVFQFWLMYKLTGNIIYQGYQYASYMKIKQY